MKIGQVAPLWLPVPPHNYGGTELTIHLLCEELVRRGHHVTLFASGDSETSAELVPIYPRGLAEAMTLGMAYEHQFYTNTAVAEVLCRRDEFDIVHLHLGCEFLSFGRLIGANRLVCTIHTPLSIDDEWILRQFPEFSVAGISRFQVSCISERPNVRVIHHGCDFDRYEFCEAPGAYLAFLGRMSRQKSPVDAIRIANRAGLPIILAGKPQNAEEVEFFTTEVKPLIDNKRVTYVGSVDHTQKVELLKNAAALVFPIQGDEAFGLAMIEAMACGTPVIACKRASVAELVTPGITGYYGDSVDELTSLVRATLSLDRRTVREHACQCFSHQRMVDEYVDFYTATLHFSGCVGEYCSG